MPQLQKYLPCVSLKNQKKYKLNGNNEIKKLIYKYESNNACTSCDEKTMIYFVNKKIEVCYNCLLIFLKENMIYRAKWFFDKKYFNLEHLLREIKIDKYYISEDEFIEITEHFNMSNALYYSAHHICCKCSSLFVYNNLYNLKCLCRNCRNCLNKKETTCYCCNKYIKENELRLPTNQEMNYSNLNNSSNIMIRYSTECMQCTKKVNEFDRYKNIRKLMDHKEIYVVQTDIKHLICSKCYYEYKSNNNRDRPKPIYCNICKRDENITKIENVGCNCSIH